MTDAGPFTIPDVSWVRQLRLSLAGHARGAVNAYVLDTRDGMVLIDTGFASTADVLGAGLEACGVGRGELLAVLCTHNHADHVGATRWLQEEGWLAPGGQVVMHELTDHVGRAVFVDRAPAMEDQLLANGVDERSLAEWQADLLAMAEQANWPVPDQLLTDGQQVQLGKVSFELLYTPGHSPDHTALLARRPDSADVLFLGDLTLGSAMPMVGVRDWLREDPIADLLASWERLVAVRSPVSLPGHGRPVADLVGQRQLILDACRERLRDFCDEFRGRAVSAADVMEERTDPAQPFGVRQFAFYNALAQLHHLSARGLAVIVAEDPVRYVVQDPARSVAGGLR